MLGLIDNGKRYQSDEAFLVRGGRVVAYNLAGIELERGLDKVRRLRPRKNGRAQVCEDTVLRVEKHEVPLIIASNLLVL